VRRAVLQQQQQEQEQAVIPFILDARTKHVLLINSYLQKYRALLMIELPSAWECVEQMCRYGRQEDLHFLLEGSQQGI
jgi:hypothetical protein